MLSRHGCSFGGGPERRPCGRHAEKREIEKKGDGPRRALSGVMQCLTSDPESHVFAKIEFQLAAAIRNYSLSPPRSYRTCQGPRATVSCRQDAEWPSVPLAALRVDRTALCKINMASAVLRYRRCCIKGSGRTGVRFLRANGPE